MRHPSKLLIILSFLSVNQQVFANECSDAKYTAGNICKISAGVIEVLNKYGAGHLGSAKFCLAASKASAEICGF